MFGFSVINAIIKQMLIVSYILQNEKLQKRYYLVPQNHGSVKVVYRDVK